MARGRHHTRRNPRSNPRGVLSVRSGGFGFVQTAEGEFFIPESKMAGAFDGDLVEVARLQPRGAQKGGRSQAAGPAGDKPVARVLRVVDRAHDTLIGRYEVAEPFGVVVPEDARIPYDIFTMRSENPQIEDGSLVRVRITTFPARNTAATGVIEEVIGVGDQEELGVELIVAHHKLETAFSEGALQQAAEAELDEAGALASGYRDLRGRFVLTIDPTDARDFDDAVSLEAVDAAELQDGGEDVGVTSGLLRADGAAGAPVWRLGVHIADVSHYVPWGSSIDLDARRRATSVYLVDRVIPMLPEALSNELCSLKPHEVRRSFTVDLYLDAKGRLAAYEIYPALIRSNARLSYQQAQALLACSGEEGDKWGRAFAAREEMPAEGEDSSQGAGASRTAWTGEAGEGSNLPFDADMQARLYDRLTVLHRIAQQRSALREKAGGIDFATTEAKVQLDGEGRAIGIALRSKTDATQLIEEAMILANETVASHLQQLKFPALYRVHDKPSSDSLAPLLPVLQEFSWFKRVPTAAFLAGDPHAVQAVVALSAGRAEGQLVSSLVLRSMKRAVYKPTCDGHYGLASSAYAHFTSPIRRYPDLVVHRMLRASMTKRPEKFDQEVSSLHWLGEHSSKMERVAEKAARESQELKMIEFMESQIGQSFSAVVSGVATYGLYVRLDNTVEGLVPSRNLGAEYFALNAELYQLAGQDTGTVYRLGQRLPVVLVAADVRRRRLDFKLAR